MIWLAPGQHSFATQGSTQGMLSSVFKFQRYCRMQGTDHKESDGVGGGRGEGHFFSLQEFFFFCTSTASA